MWKDVLDQTDRLGVCEEVILLLMQSFCVLITHCSEVSVHLERFSTLNSHGLEISKSQWEMLYFFKVPFIKSTTISLVLLAVLVSPFQERCADDQP